MKNLFVNRWVFAALGLYVAGFAVLSRRPEFSLSDALFELLIFGVGFSLIAWWTTARARPLVIALHPTGREMLGLVAYVMALSIYLAFGPQTIDVWLPPDWISSERIRFFVTLTKKLLVFVAIPFALFGALCGYRWRDFGWQRENLRELFRSHLPVVLGVSAAILAFQSFSRGRRCSAPRRQIQRPATSSRLAALFRLAGY